MFHTPTLVAAMIVGFATLVLALAAVLNGPLKDQAALRSVTFGSLAALVGVIAFALRPHMPTGLSIFAANAAMFGGLLFYTRATYQFVLDRPQPRWILILYALMLLFVLAMLERPLPERVTLFSFFNALLLSPAVVLIIRRGWHMERSLRTAGISMAVGTLAMALRTVHAVLYPEQYDNLSNNGFGNGVAFLVGLMSLIGVGFGFVLAGLERVAARMEELAIRDALTGCYNRHTADSLLEHALQRGQRDGAPVAYVLLDLDHFKQINDHHGHRAGDEALRQFAQAVRARLRGADVFARMGGEEFGLVLPATDPVGALHLTDAVRLAVAGLRIRSPDGSEVSITVSAGVAVALPGGTATADHLYARADLALYRAKAEGRNRVLLAE